jgi:hypothetical protein
MTHPAHPPVSRCSLDVFACGAYHTTISCPWTLRRLFSITFPSRRTRCPCRGAPIEVVAPYLRVHAANCTGTDQLCMSYIRICRIPRTISERNSKGMWRDLRHYSVVFVITALGQQEELHTFSANTRVSMDCVVKVLNVASACGLFPFDGVTGKLQPSRPYIVSAPLPFRGPDKQ